MKSELKIFFWPVANPFFESLRLCPDLGLVGTKFWPGALMGKTITKSLDLSRWLIYWPGAK
jgi:hypothetical protein